MKKKIQTSASSNASHTQTLLVIDVCSVRQVSVMVIVVHSKSFVGK